MTKLERIRAAIAGEQTDRIPYSLWSHIPGVDLIPEKIAEETYRFYKKFDVDFVKTLNNGMYSVEDFGGEVDYSGIEKGGVAALTRSPVSSAEDWDTIRAADTGKGALARELRYLDLLMERLDGEPVPVVFTIFSPLTTASKLSENRIMEHIRQGQGRRVHRALEAITETTCRLVERAIEGGASGIFFATQLSNYGIMPEAWYEEFGKPYDIRVLESSKGWCNMLHAHGDDIMFPLLRDYPAQVFNWHVGESLPDMDEALLMTKKCVMGGLRRGDITEDRRNAIANQIYRAIRVTGGRRLILTPGCVIRYPLNENTMHYVKQAKEAIEQEYRKEMI